jgi:hypothetical protein
MIYLSSLSNSWQKYDTYRNLDFCLGLNCLGLVFRREVCEEAGVSELSNL